MPTLQTNDVETYYEREGEGPPVVMAHGAGYDHRWWEPQVEALRDEYELITYDLRGHGRTGGGVDWHQYEMGLYALDLHRLIEGLDLDRPVVVGHSLGGMFLPALAARYPGSLRGIVLADAQVEPGAGIEEWVFRNVAHPAVILTSRLFGLDRAEALNETIARLLSDEDEPTDNSEPDSELAAYREVIEQERDRTEVIRVQRGLRRFSAAPLDEVPVPVLGVYGSLDRDLMAHSERALRAGADDVETREVADAGHLLTWTHAEAFDEELRSFLDRLTDGGC